VSSIEAVGIVVPARNEADTIGSCIGSLARTVRHCGLPGWIVVVADSCEDPTAQRARSALADTGSQGEVLECSYRSVGAGRRLGTGQVLCRWPELSLNAIWLASTDADSEVPLDWLAQQLSHAQEGVCAIAGTVRIVTSNRQLAARFHNHYRVESDGSHGHVHGANLGMRADAYADAGGWPASTVGEDHTLWQRLGRRGWARKTVSSNAVTTSARIQGRATGGFADVLSQLGCASGPVAEPSL
jgi:cellulose synthase/poly-beta-1,6-N-acetylglucosamine synthase-like glycosyltransferase